MSADARMKDAVRTGMNGWRGYGILEPCKWNIEYVRKMRWGLKKGIRRARRRLAKILIGEQVRD